MAALITLDTYKQMIKADEAFNIAESFNARVGDEQVPLVVKFLERGKVQQFEDGLVPFMSGFVGNLDDKGKVTAETGEPVSYTGTRSDIVGLGMVKMNLPGTMFPQEGYFYGFLGLETPDHSKRVSTFSVWFHVYNGNPDMFVNKEPFRSELQKELDYAELLIKQVDEEGKAKLKELEDKVNDLITSKNIDLSQLESRMATADGNLKILEEKIKADGLLTQAEFDAAVADLKKYITEQLAIVNTPFKYNPSNDIGGDVKSDYLPNYISKIDQNRFNIAVITDPHYQDRYLGPHEKIDYPYSKYSINHLADFLELANHVDLAISLGDNNGGNNVEKSRNYADEALYNDRLLYTSTKGDVALVPGNHDDGSPVMYSRNIPNGIIKEAELKELFATTTPRFGEKRDGDSLYFFKDYDEHKIRVITLWTNDVPEDVLASDGNLKYPRWFWHGFREKQLDWFANTALKVPKDYQVIIMAHAPLSADKWVDDDKNVHCINHDLVAGIINAFVNGSTFVSKGTVTDWKANVSCDFTSQGAGTLIGWFDGHKHREQIDVHNDFTQVEMLNDFPPKESDVGTGNEGAMTVISIDTANKQVDLLGWGRATNRSMTY